MKTRRRLIIVGLVALALIVGFFVHHQFFLQRPPMPAEWRHLRAGMTRDAVIAAVGPITVDFRELKGWDGVFVTTKMGGSPADWQLFLVYDETSGLLTEASVQFTNRGNGYYNTTERFIPAKP
jgi:hypothetical protein